MYFLISSSKRKRYRDDILRCLALPIGTRVQFRYAKALVSENMVEHPDRVRGCEALVCSVDLDIVSVPCTLIPVRIVTIENLYLHGSSVTLTLRVGEFSSLESQDPAAFQKFTEEV